MKITVENKEYTIKFSYALDPGKTTECLILCSEGPTIHGWAICSSRDQFSYARGRKIAFAHALLLLSRDLRKKIWQAVWEERKKITKKEWSI